MAANGRLLDKYAQRRRAEQQARRRAGYQPQRRPTPRPRDDGPPPNVARARVLLPILLRARPELPEPSRRTRWTYEHDVMLVRCFADGMAAVEVAASLRLAVRPCATPGGCERRIRALWDLYGPGVPA